MKGRKS